MTLLLAFLVFSLSTAIIWIICSFFFCAILTAQSSSFHWHSDSFEWGWVGLFQRWPLLSLTHRGEGLLLQQHLHATIRSIKDRAESQAQVKDKSTKSGCRSFWFIKYGWDACISQTKAILPTLKLFTKHLIRTNFQWPCWQNASDLEAIYGYGETAGLPRGRLPASGCFHQVCLHPGCRTQVYKGPKCKLWAKSWTNIAIYLSNLKIEQWSF